MPAAVSLVVVSLSVELTSPQTRAGDAHGCHPLASAAECVCVSVSVSVCVFVCVKEGITRGQGLEVLSFCPLINILCLHSCNCQISRKMTQNTATIYCFIACKILKLKYKYLVLFIKRL